MKTKDPNLDLNERSLQMKTNEPVFVAVLTPLLQHFSIYGTFSP